MIKSLCLTLVLAFAVMGQAIAKDPEPPVTIVTRVLGWSPFPRDAPLPRLQVAFEDNPALAKITETYLAAQGFSIAGPDGAHDYKVALSGNFAFDRPRTKRLSVPIGKLLADERMKDTLTSLAELSTRGHADQNLASNLFLVPLGKTAVLTGLGTDLMEIISSHIGLSGAFNRLVVGDERGVCIPIPPGACDKWNHYNQRLALKATVMDDRGGVEEVSVSISANHPRLLPAELLAEGQARIALLLLPEGFQPTSGHKDVPPPDKDALATGLPMQ